MIDANREKISPHTFFSELCHEENAKLIQFLFTVTVQVEWRPQIEHKLVKNGNEIN